MTTFEGHLYSLQDMPNSASTAAVCLEHLPAEEAGQEERLVFLTNAGEMLYAPPIPGIRPEEAGERDDLMQLKRAYDLYVSGRLLRQERDETLRMITEVRLEFDGIVNDFKHLATIAEEAETHDDQQSISESPEPPRADEGNTAPDGGVAS